MYFLMYNIWIVTFDIFTNDLVDVVNIPGF